MIRGFLHVAMVGAVALTGASCAEPTESLPSPMATPTALGERNVSSSHTLAEAPPALRAAVIGTTQREAGPSYALDLVDDGEGERAYETEIGTTQRVARFNKNGAALTLGATT